MGLAVGVGGFDLAVVAVEVVADEDDAGPAGGVGDCGSEGVYW